MRRVGRNADSNPDLDFIVSDQTLTLERVGLVAESGFSDLLEKRAAQVSLVVAGGHAL
jgi:hypothetical protein